MWNVIYIATNRQQAEAFKTILTEEGILADIRPAKANAKEGMHEVLALESEADEAHRIICKHMMK